MTNSSDCFSEPTIGETSVSIVARIICIVRSKQIKIFTRSSGQYIAQNRRGIKEISFEEIEEYRDKISDIAYDIELSTGIILSPVIKNIEKYNFLGAF